MSTAPKEENPLIRALCDPSVYDHEVEAVHIIETHISWILLTGLFAYKVKKPIRLPFVDFSTLNRRQHFCKEELRLNQRFAADVYLRVVPIGGSVQTPVIDAHPAIEYAVKMRQFPANARMDKRLAQGNVTSADIRALAELIASFHESLVPCRSEDRRGYPVDITRAVLSNLREVKRLLNSPKDTELLTNIDEWTMHVCLRLQGTFSVRKMQGAIREGHGDLHLENLTYWNDRLVPFDALEFDPNLRSIDVMNEVAFLVMDLMAHERSDLAYEFLNRYLEMTVDYTGLGVLKFYLVHRALVRAKVAAIRGSRHGASAPAIFSTYLRFADALTKPASPLLLITHGLSGSGKTTVTEQLISRLPAIRCRSDLERKRLHGLRLSADSGSEVGGGLYTRHASQRTYAKLEHYAACGLRGGLNMIVDATFLRHADRKAFQSLAARENVRIAILDCRAPEAVLRRRIKARGEQHGNTSEATFHVLDYQLSAAEPLDEQEEALTVPIDTHRAIDYDALTADALCRRIDNQAAAE